MHTYQTRIFVLSIIVLVLAGFSLPAGTSTSKLLPEMSWVDVQDYLKTCKMVIIPLGSIEQHGPHMPLGTDYYEALEICKKISSRTGVVVVPVLWVGYSLYHSGFPGTLSLKPETMEQVLFETVAMLMKYGFNRFMFFNYHGGNNVVQSKVIHRINHLTTATAIAIGHGSDLQKDADEDEDFFDWHAGKNETSIMLYLRPDLVKMERAKKPVITFTPKMKELSELSKKYPELLEVWTSLLGVPTNTKKGGASHELSSNGIWSFNDPNEATRKIGEKTVNKMLEKAVKFIKAWKLAKK